MKANAMYSIILAGGKGTRLAPLTYYIPKLLMPVRGKPLLSYTINLLEALPIDCHYVLASKSLQTIDTYLERTGQSKIKSIQVLGWETGGDLAIGLEEIARDEDAIIINGDLITDISLKKLYEFHKSRKADVTIALFKLKDIKEARRFGVVKANADGKIIQFTEKPEAIDTDSALVSMGIYIFDKEFIRKRSQYLIPKKVKLENELFPRLVKEGKLYGYVTDIEYWWDIGTIQSYLEAENALAKKEGVIA